MPVDFIFIFMHLAGTYIQVIHLLSVCVSILGGYWLSSTCAAL